MRSEQREAIHAALGNVQAARRELQLWDHGDLPTVDQAELRRVRSELLFCEARLAAVLGVYQGGARVLETTREAQLADAMEGRR